MIKNYTKNLDKFICEQNSEKDQQRDNTKPASDPSLRN